MSVTFITRHPVGHDIDPKSPDIIYMDAEFDHLSAEQSLKHEYDAFKKADIQDGDIVYVTVAYSDGRYKPGNFRNAKRRARYKTLADDTPYISLFPIWEG